MASVLQEFVNILISAISSLGTGIASGISATVQALFLEVTEGTVTGLSMFGGVIAIFAGLALAVKVTTMVYTWIVTLGN